MDGLSLSDSNISTSISQIVSRNKQYADLDLSLKIHPDFHDILPLVDIDAVKNSVRCLILTNFFERPFQPYLASNIRALLFEPADRFTVISIREWIKDVLVKYEPRVDSIRVDVVDESENNRYRVTLTFRIINVSREVNIALYLERLR